MPELAKAYVQIIPSATGIKGSLTSIMDPEADSAGQSAGTTFSGGFSKTIGAVAKIGAAALGAAAAAAGKFVKDAVSGYADFAQLAGGVETLFGSASETVMTNAENAFRTAGLTANEYMETVTSFSASLLQSLGGDTAEAASVADMAITDMSDNANKMGTSMESIQAAYQGFAKQNYTMLDNLKLGYGGTKEEMQRLLADATALSGVEYDISSLNDVYAAIHVVQTELGITGTTATEASTTISGSLGTVKAAWSNLVAGIANPDADIGALIGDVVSSAQDAAGNLLPAIETALSGIGQLVTGLAPVIAEALPSLISTTLPDLLAAAESLISALVSALPEVISVLTSEGLPILLSGAISLVVSLLSHLDQIVVPIINSIPVVFQAVATSMSQAIPTLTSAMPVVTQSILSAITEATPLMIQTGVAFLESLISDLPLIIETVCSAIPDIVLALVDLIIQSAPLIIEAGVQLLCSLISNLPLIISTILTSIPQIIESICSGLIERWPDIQQAGVELFECLVTNIDQAVESVLTALGGLLTEIYNGVVAGVSDMLSAGGQLVAGIWQGISGSLQWIKTKITGWVGDVLGFVKGLFGIASPSKVFAGFGLNLAQGLGVGIENGIGVVEDAIGDMSDAAVDAWSADQLNTTLTGSADYSFGRPGEAVTGGNGGADILSAIYAVGNMIVAAVNEIDPDIQLDGASLADKLYHYNLEAANRYGAAMVT